MDYSIGSLFLGRTSDWAARASLIICLALPAIGCGGGDDSAAAGQGPGPGGPGGRGGGRPATPAMPVAVARADLGDIASYYSATATLEAQKEAQVLARASGVITRIDREEGDRVTRGQTLLRIDDAEYRLRLAQAEAEVMTQQSRFDRLEGMFRESLVSAEEFDAIKNGLESAKAEAGLAELNLSYTNVRAPFNGQVVQRLVDAGQTVSPGTPLFNIADFDPLLARVYVPSKEFRKLRPDQTVELRLDSDARSLEGRITLVSPVIDPTSGTIKVTVEIPTYPAGTRPGDFAEVKIVTELRTETLLVPKVAVLTDKGTQVVYVAADSVAQRRVVEVGFQDENNAEILSGVTAGELVVVRGQRSLKEDAPIKIMEDTLGDPVDTADTVNAAAKGS